MIKRRYILVALAVLAGAVAPSLAAPKAPNAAALLSAKDAVALVGGPLGETFQHESKPDSENGHDHNTISSYFPKGYHLAEANRPPERGVQLSLHRFKTPKEAKTFYDLTADTEREMAAGAGARVEALKGVGKAGVLSVKKLTPEPKAIYQVGIATFLKGSVMGQLTVWKRDASVAAAATAGAKRITAKLP